MFFLFFFTAALLISGVFGTYCDLLRTTLTVADHIVLSRDETTRAFHNDGYWYHRIPESNLPTKNQLRTLKALQCFT